MLVFLNCHTNTTRKLQSKLEYLQIVYFIRNKQMLLCLMILTGLTAGVQDHEGSTVNVTLSNTFLPKDTDGRQLQTGELQVFDNHNRDGYWCVLALQLRTPLTYCRPLQVRNALREDT